MDGIFNVAALHGIVMNVFQLLYHHLPSLDQLRMASLLPDLKFTFLLVSRFMPLKLIQQQRNSLLLQYVDDPTCSEGLEVVNVLAQVR